MPTIENKDDVIEIRIFLRREREEDKDLFPMFEKLGEELKPLNNNQIGKYVLQKAHDLWYQKRDK